MSAALSWLILWRRGSSSGRSAPGAMCWRCRQCRRDLPNRHTSRASRKNAEWHCKSDFRCGLPGPLSIARDLLDSDIREPLFVRVASAVDSSSDPESLARQGLLDEIDLVGALTGQPVVRVRAILDEGAVSGLVQLETPGPFGLIDIGGAGPDGPLLEILATEGSLIVDGPPASRLRHISVNGDVVVAGTEMVDIRRRGLSSLLTEFIAQMRGDARRRTESDAYALSVGRAIWQSVTTGDSVQVDRAPKPNR